MHKTAILTLVFIVSFITIKAQNDTINQTDADSLRQGYWLKSHENGNKQAEGYFKDGKQIGTFTHYHLNGTVPKAIIKHKPNSDTTIATYFHENKVVMSEGIYVNQKKEGLWKFYDNRKLLSSQEEYANDKQHGETVVYHLDGSIAKEVSFKEGLEQGEFKEYAPDGKIIIEGKYIDGNYDGVIKFYYSNGRLKNQGMYNHAVKNGKWIYYDPDGNVQVTEMYENGYLKSRVMSDEMQQKQKELEEERKQQYLNPGESKNE